MASIDNSSVFSDSQRLRSNKLKELLLASIENTADGVIGFDKFMEIVLYTPNLGYYDAGEAIFGREGDFLTAPSSGQLFGKCLANEMGSILCSLNNNILEFGAGNGSLARTICAALDNTVGVQEFSYHIVEPSESLWLDQKASVKGFPGAFFWHRSVPSSISKGVLIANEVVDAMPAARFLVDNGEISELGVAFSGHKMIWKKINTDVPEQIERALSGYQDGYQTEMITGLKAWLNSIYSSINESVFLIIDYGYPQSEFLREDRIGGTLKCHFRHTMNSDPFQLLGLQDITTSVNFSMLASIAIEIGFDILGFTTQERFLANNKIDHFFSESNSENSVESYRLAQEAKRLLLPTEMGQYVKVMALGKNFNGQLCGFENDERFRL